MATVRGVRHFHSRFFSSSSSQAATEISNLVSGSNIEQPVRSSAASFTSERPIRKKVSAADRKAMLESFVNKYRGMNMGKFPSPTCARKEVGGGYYVIKKLLQEIKYDGMVEQKPENKLTDESLLEEKFVSEDLQSKVELQPDGNKNIATENCDTEGQCHGKVEQKPEDKLIDEFLLEENFVLKSKVELQPDGIKNIATENCDTEGQCHVKVEQKPEDKLIDESLLEEKFVSEDLQSKVELQPDGIKNIAAENCDTGGQCHGKIEQKPEDKLIDESLLEEKFLSEDLQSKGELHHDGIRNINRDMPEQQKDDKLREKPSLWGNLKSLATDFINMWKK